MKTGELVKYGRGREQTVTVSAATDDNNVTSLRAGQLYQLCSEMLCGCSRVIALLCYRQRNPRVLLCRRLSQSVGRYNFKRTLGRH